MPRSRHVTNAIDRQTTGCCPVSYLIQERRLCFSGRHVARADLKHRVIEASLRPPSRWRRHCGRPRYTWLRGINSDVQSVNIGIHSVTVHSGDTSSTRQHSIKGPTTVEECPEKNPWCQPIEAVGDWSVTWARSTQPSTLHGTVKWISALGLSNNKWRWWMRTVAVISFWRTHSPSRLAWSEGWRPPRRWVCIHQMNRVNSRNGFAMMTAP